MIIKRTKDLIKKKKDERKADNPRSSTKRMKKGMCDERVEEEEMEGSAWQHHPKYLEPSSVCNCFFYTPHLSASWRQRLHLQALFFFWHLPSLHHSPARTTMDATTPWTMAFYVTAQFLFQRLQTRHGWSNGHHPAVSRPGGGNPPTCAIDHSSLWVDPSDSPRQWKDAR